jgi:hypothetical protein
MRIVTFGLAFTSLAWLYGCATPGSIVEASGANDRRFTTRAACREVAEHVMPALRDLGFRTEIGPRQETCPIEVVVRRPASAISWGELVRLRLYEGETRSVLAIRTERVLATNITARRDWADRIYLQIVGRMSHGSP